jgi:hypothetical protein
MVRDVLLRYVMGFPEQEIGSCDHMLYKLLRT